MSDNEKKLTAYERWELPHLESAANPKQSSQALAIKPDDAVEVSEEIDEDSLVYEPLTAQQLEEIRSAAYEEGYAQGHEEGIKAGHEEGSLKGHEEGFQQGLEQGIAEGTEKALQEGIALAESRLGSVEQLLSSVLNEFEHPLESSRDQLEHLLQSATKRIVEHVIKRELGESSDALLTSELEKVLNTLGEQEGRAVLRVHPDNLEAAQALASDQRLTLKIKPDSSLIEGGFILDSHAFYVDGTIESRLSDVLKSLDPSE